MDRAKALIFKKVDPSEPELEKTSTIFMVPSLTVGMENSISLFWVSASKRNASQFAAIRLQSLSRFFRAIAYRGSDFCGLRMRRPYRACLFRVDYNKQATHTHTHTHTHKDFFDFLQSRRLLTHRSKPLQHTACSTFRR